MTSTGHKETYWELNLSARFDSKPSITLLPKKEKDF